MQNEFKIVPITNKNIIDMTGETYGRLTVLGLSDKKTSGAANWVCQCVCGNKTTVRRDHLTSGNTTSCGCYANEQTSKRNTTHGEWGTRLYIIWSNMKDRCNNPNADQYSAYGGRGIVVSDEWSESYETFANWAKNNGYQDDLTIDRIDNNGDYEESNCRFISMQEQHENTQKTIMIEHEGKNYALSKWSRILGINRNTLRSRYYQGDRGDRLFRPVRK